MKVGELIEILQKYNPGIEVAIPAYESGANHLDKDDISIQSFIQKRHPDDSGYFGTLRSSWDANHPDAIPFLCIGDPR